MKVPGLRSPYEKVSGIVYFGRMLDKIRLRASGWLPDGYNLGTQVRTWFDARCTRFLAVEYEALVQRVLRGVTPASYLFGVANRYPQCSQPWMISDVITQT